MSKSRMALSMDTSAGRGGRRRVDSVVNMVPFIDLLVCCIAFLIITAVWTQLERLDLRATGGPPVPGEEALPASPQLVLRMGEAGMTIVDEVGAAVAVPKVGERQDLTRLGRELGALRRTMPDKTRLVVAPDDGQRYDDIVGVMDAAVGARFDDLSVSSDGQ